MKRARTKMGAEKVMSFSLHSSSENFGGGRRSSSSGSNYEGVSLAIGAKVPGQGMTIRTVHMDFLYGGAFRTGMPEAYERLILDTLLGDGTLFTRADEVEEQWLLVDAIVAGWQRDRPGFPNYAAGTWGPPSADDLLHRDGRSWRRH